MEAVIGFQFGVFAFNHFEAAFAEVLQQHASVGCPRDGEVPVFGDVGGVEGAAQHRVGGFSFAVAVGGEVVPVAEAHAAGEDGMGGGESFRAAFQRYRYYPPAFCKFQLFITILRKPLLPHETAVSLHTF